MELSLGTCVSIKEAVCAAAASLSLSGVNEVSLQGWGSSRSTIVEGRATCVTLFCGAVFVAMGTQECSSVHMCRSITLSLSLSLSVSLSVAIFLPRHTMLICVRLCTCGGNSVSTNVI